MADYVGNMGEMCENVALCAKRVIRYRDRPALRRFGIAWDAMVGCREWWESNAPSCVYHTEEEGKGPGNDPGGKPALASGTGSGSAASSSEANQGEGAVPLNPVPQRER